MASLHYSNEKIMERPVHLSVVATSRNDNHGKNLLYRMQHFVDGFIEQCKRHDLRAELILVEWNPPNNTPPLVQALHFPKDKGPCSVRIIQVPKEVHLKLDHAEKLPLFQMIGKNVGIRRASGRFVLATNIDILFSNRLIRFIKSRLKTGCLYRVDRLDIPEQLPQTTRFKEILLFCSQNFFRVNGKKGTIDVKRTCLFDRVKSVFTAITKNTKVLNINRGLSETVRLLKKGIKNALKPSKWNVFLIRGLNKTVRLLKRVIKNALKPSKWNIFLMRGLNKAVRLLKRVIKRLMVLGHSNKLPLLHTNACGDFTLLSSEDWSKLKGYPEWSLFSWHIDGVLLYQARQHGIKERDLPRRMPIYHIEHEIGSGYSPEGAQTLFRRLKDRGIPYLSNTDLEKIVSHLNEPKQKIFYNGDDWGLGNILLKEFVI